MKCPKSCMNWVIRRYSANSLRSLAAAAALPNSLEASFAESDRAISSGSNAYQVFEERLLYLLKRCTDLKSMKMMHAHLIKAGFCQNVFVVSSIILFCAEASPPSEAMDYALSVFNQMENPDGFTWNTMIRGLGRTDDPVRALLIYQRMQEAAVAVSPDNFTFSFLLKVCAQLPSLALGGQLHSACAKHGVESHEFVSNTLVYMYAMCGRMEDARKLFDEMLQRDVISWNTLIDGYVHSDRPEEAFALFQMMREMGMAPDEVTLVLLLSACVNTGSLGLGRSIHSVVILLGHDKSVPIQNTLLHMYAKCGKIDDARRIFYRMHGRNQVSWNAMIQGLAFHGHAAEALEVFSQMEMEMETWQSPPDDVTFLSILSACSHAGLVDKGKKHLYDMIRKYKLIPSVKHYGCIVDLLGRSGLVDEAYEFVQSMPAESRNAIIWRTVLGACRVHGKLELAERVRRHLLDLEPDHSGDYVLLSHVYATEGRWKDSVKVRQDMRDRGVQKPEPGNSIIDLDPNVACCI